MQLRLSEQLVKMKLVCWQRSLVHRFVERTNTAAAVPHKIFIHDTCFIITIDPLSLRRWHIDLGSVTEAKPWRQTKSWKWISIDVVKVSSFFSVLSQFYGYSSVWEWGSVSELTDADIIMWVLTKVLTNCVWCWKAETEARCVVFLHGSQSDPKLDKDSSVTIMFVCSRYPQSSTYFRFILV